MLSCRLLTFASCRHLLTLYAIIAKEVLHRGWAVHVLQGCAQAGPKLLGWLASV